MLMSTASHRRERGDKASCEHPWIGETARDTLRACRQVSEYVTSSRVREPTSETIRGAAWILEGVQHIRECLGDPEPERDLYLEPIANLWRDCGLDAIADVLRFLASVEETSTDAQIGRQLVFQWLEYMVALYRQCADDLITETAVAAA
jgi:hypothetical protein